MNTNRRSSRIEASCSSRLICSSGGGRFDGGIWLASGGIETREARGAVVGGINVASGFQGTVWTNEQVSQTVFIRGGGGVPRPALAMLGLAFFSRVVGLLARRPVMVVSVMWVRSVVRFSPMMVPAGFRAVVRRELEVEAEVVGGGVARWREAASRVGRREESA